VSTGDPVGPSANDRSESIVLQPHWRTVDKLASVDYCRRPVLYSSLIQSKYLCVLGLFNPKLTEVCVRPFLDNPRHLGLRNKILDGIADFGRTKNDIMDHFFLVSLVSGHELVCFAQLFN